jgi:hypothetical protein
MNPYRTIRHCRLTDEPGAPETRTLPITATHKALER